MDELKKAKLRAIIFLLRIIDQKWQSYSENIKDDKYYTWQAIDWPLRFESYCYLANKDKSRKYKYALELRELWNEWVDLNRRDLIGNERTFWPAEFAFTIDGKYSPGNELENHISMFRAREIFGIGGFESYFNEAKERLKNLLLGKSPDFPELDFKVGWQILRCQFLKEELSEYLKMTELRIKADKWFNKLIDFEKEDYPSIWQRPAWRIFFLCFCNLSAESFLISKRVASNLISLQKNDGSFDEDVLTTSLCIAVIHSTNVDPSKTVISKALNYIFSKQNEEGYWRFLYGESDTWNVFLTVIVLEILDFVTDDKPLPSWAEEKKEDDVLKKPTLSRIQIVRPLPVLEGINWFDVSIQFLSEENVEIRAGKPLGVKNFIELGFKDNRTGKPDLAWHALRHFALTQGEISWLDKDVSERTKVNLKSSLKVLRQRLRFLFSIEDDPFKPYDRKGKAYRAKFRISVREDINEEILS